MDKETLAVLVRRAGLEKTFAEFPEDVEIAADQATRSAGRMQPPSDPRAEPWPPMKPGDGL